MYEKSTLEKNKLKAVNKLQVLIDNIQEGEITDIVLTFEKEGRWQSIIIGTRLGHMIEALEETRDKLRMCQPRI